MPDLSLNSKIIKEIETVASTLEGGDRFLTERQLSKYLDTFRVQFGPEHLARLDGPDLLEKLHNQSNRESLVYWLEFKNDEEFPTPRFGSIAGGSALKFSIFFRRETGSWMGRGSGSVPVEITEAEALARARKHRDQLLAGADLLKNTPSGASEEQYQQLQESMDARAPDVSVLAWGHKYFSLLYPDKLDSFHNADLQRFHLIKLLQDPGDLRGRYALARWFVRLAGVVGLNMSHFAEVLKARHGRLHRYWRIETSEGDGKPSYWSAMKNSGFAAMGWEKLGDLSSLTTSTNAKADLRKKFEDQYPGAPTGRKAGEIFRFLRDVDEGDVIVAADGAAILGIGRISAGNRYVFQAGDEAPHRRAVEWIDDVPWSLPRQDESLQMAFRELRTPENLLAIERRLLGLDKPVVVPVIHQPAPQAIPRLSGIAGRVQSILERKGQVILYGPPGTGKTYWAEKTANDLASYRAFDRPHAELESEQRKEFANEGLVRMCTFHPAFGYEDFLEGFRPRSEDGRLTYSLEDGLFKQLCLDAENHQSRDYYLLIDEINRGDIPRIFGELLTVIERSRRGRSIRLAVSGAQFHVPPNVYLIGTMNTADRSIALLDKALRRRFGFVECMPDARTLGTVLLRGIPLGPWLDAVNRRVREVVGRDARNLQLGHSYLMEGGRPISEFSRFVNVLQDEIVPLLEEYCYEDYSALAGILGSGLVDVPNQAIRTDLFEDARRDELVQALLEPHSDIATSRQALILETADAAGEEDESAAGEGAQ